MCGIIYTKRLDGLKAKRQVLKRYTKQRHRGMDGFGYIGVKSNGTISALKRTQYEHEIRAKLEESTLSEILFHHRYPTSTPNVPESAHPIPVSHKELAHNYYVVHNGVIRDEEKLKEAHEKLGYRYSTEIKTQYRTKKGHVYTSETVFNDSEALAIELARTIEGLQSECMAKGAIAYIAYQVDKHSDKVVAVYFGTNGGNPLRLQRSKEYIAIASEGAGIEVEDNKSYRLDAITNEIVEVPIKLQPFYSPSAMGYTRSGSTANTTTHHGHTSGMQEWRESQGYLSDGYGGYLFDDKPRYDTEAQGILLLESEMEELQEELIGLKGDILFYENEGDADMLAQAKQDYQDVTARYNTLNSQYERQANATA